MKRTDFPSLLMALALGFAIFIYLYSMRTYYEVRQWRTDLTERR
jgi:hypothetical protein